MVLQIEFPHQISYLKWIYFAIRQLTKTILSPPFETKLLLVIQVRYINLVSEYGLKSILYPIRCKRFTNMINYFLDTYHHFTTFHAPKGIKIQTTPNFLYD